MPANNVIKIIGFAGIIFLLNSCGQRGVPTGGPKDETPPKVVKSVPVNNGTNFTGNKITLKFDEFIQVKNFNNEFVVSPPVKKQPKYNLSGKKLSLEFDSAFAENTTYSLYFGKSIVDLNEGNVLDQNTFTFSTGAQLDSLALKGKLVDASSGESVNNVMVHLYRNLNDSAPIKLFPSYFASAKNGEFNFANLAAGEYKIFALEDANRNYKYDLPNERIAFLSGAVKVPQDSAELVLRLFSPEKTNQRVFKPSSPVNGKVLIPFNKEVKNFSIDFLSYNPSTDSLIQIWNIAKDTLSLYSAQFLRLDTLTFRIKVDGEIDDTLKVSFKKKKFIFAPQASYSTISSNDYHEPLTFNFPLPLGKYDLKRIKIISGKDTVNPTNAELSANKLTLKITFPFQEGANYKMLVLPKTFQSILYHNNDSLKYGFSMLKKEDFGSLIIKYNLASSGNIMQLSKNGVVVKEQLLTSTSGEIAFAQLLAGEYKLKFLQDSNKDGKWSTGNYFENRQPESSILYNKPILIRANWDLEIAAP